MEDLRHTGSSIIGFTILDVKNYELAKTSGEMSQVISYTISVHSSEIRGLRSTKFSSKTLQNLLYFMYKKTHVVFFVFLFMQLYISTL